MELNSKPKCVTENKAAAYASYIALYQITKQKKAHTIDEELLMYVIKAVVKTTIVEKESKKLDSVSLSNNAVKRSIVDMSNDVLEQMLNEVKNSPLYSIQLDESTDVAGLSQLSVFIRYIYNAEVSKNLLVCKELKLCSAGEDIFQCLNNFFTEHSISWDKYAGICIDGAVACTGVKSKVIKQVQGKH